MNEWILVEFLESRITKAFFGIINVKGCTGCVEDERKKKSRNEKAMSTKTVLIYIPNIKCVGSRKSWEKIRIIKETFPKLFSSLCVFSFQLFALLHYIMYTCES